MSNRTDWEKLAAEILDRGGYVDDPDVAKLSLQERFEAELHNAFTLGQDTGARKASAKSSDLVWQNECRLVFSVFEPGRAVGEMGVCYPYDHEVQVEVRSVGSNEFQQKLKDVPVKITIERVPGGNS